MSDRRDGSRGACHLAGVGGLIGRRRVGHRWTPNLSAYTQRQRRPAPKCRFARLSEYLSLARRKVSPPAGSLVTGHGTNNRHRGHRLRKTCHAIGSRAALQLDRTDSLAAVGFADVTLDRSTGTGSGVSPCPSPQSSTVVVASSLCGCRRTVLTEHDFGSTAGARARHRPALSLGVDGPSSRLWCRMTSFRGRATGCRVGRRVVIHSHAWRAAV